MAFSTIEIVEEHIIGAVGVDVSSNALNEPSIHNAHNDSIIEAGTETRTNAHNIEKWRHKCATGHTIFFCSNLLFFGFSFLKTIWYGLWTIL